MGLEEVQGTVSNFLAPKVEKTSDSEVEDVCKKYGITKNQLPWIKITDPSLANLQVAVGDVVKIARKNFATGKETSYYRWVVP